MPIDSQVEVKRVRLVKGTGSQIDAARQAGEILETDFVAQTDAPDLVPETRTINGHPLSSNISLDASDVGAVASNTAITGATKCKITYDSKGLVTAGADLTPSDITTALGYTPYNSTNPSGYQANVIETVKVNGTALTPSSKAVDIIIPTNNNQLTNGAGYITSSALNGYATQTWVGQQGYLTSTALNGYATEQWVGQQGYITGISSSDVTSALGYTPYNSSNPNGYTSNVGTVTSVNNVQPVNGNVTISIPTQVTENTVSGWGFTKNLGTVTSVNNVSPVNGNVTLSIPSDISSNKVNGAPLSTSSAYFFGVSDSAATDVEKVVSIPSITSLSAGQFIIVLPTVTSTVENSTLKLNNFTAYPMRYQNSAITTSTDAYVWTANTPSVFVFDGEYWRFVCQGYRNVYSAMSVSEGTTGTATTSRVMRADRLKQIIQDTTLTGIDTSTSGTVVATDTITQGIGKLQAQIGSIETALHTINSGS